MVAAIGVLVIAGCGGPMSRQEYLAAGNEICRELDEQAQRLGHPQTFEETVQALASEGPDLASAARDAAEEFRDLRPPASLRARHATLAAQLADDADALEAAVTTARELEQQVEDGEEIDELGRAELEADVKDLEASERESQQTAREMELEDCAKP